MEVIRPDEDYRDYPNQKYQFMKTTEAKEK